MVERKEGSFAHRNNRAGEAFEFADREKKAFEDIDMGASAQQGDERLSDPALGQGTGGSARTRDRRIPADRTAVSPTTELSIAQLPRSMAK
ncbi:hypothetical protein PoB_003234200 [Plakobranchus ocellatus]|uniref:Uncharacterized protein n=1 Tax=Plakobranchus ocellatus TaxID=259542 RepID=A0AAV4AFN1_9GAST|nr:hypothetical protein PoB_003234200 [Plakobranchus ocellatus]